MTELPTFASPDLKRPKLEEEGEEEPRILPQLQRPRHYSLKLQSLLEKFSYLFEISVVDFFTLEGIRRVPEEWQEILREGGEGKRESESESGKSEERRYDTEFIKDLIKAAGEGVVKEDWPSSLKEFFLEAYQTPLQSYYTDKVSKKSVSVPAIDQRFRIKMSPKKLHEVGIMSELVGTYGKSHGVTGVVDLGSGQGYLDRLIAYQHGLNVLGVDGDPDQTSGARKIDAMFSKRAGKSPKIKPGSLSHSTLMISTDTLDALQSEVVKFTSEDWLLCGLHTCGPLAYTMLDLFMNTSAKCLVTVACCYHRLEGTHDFPRSQFLKSAKLDRIAYRISCQTPTTWPDNPENCFEFFKRHFFRALLQKLMVDNHWLKTDDHLPTVGKLPKGSYVDFATYATRALELFQLPTPDRSTLMTFHDQHYDGYSQIAFVWTLQSALAPSIESLLIMDRFLALEEFLGHAADSPSGRVNIVPLFDLLLSPRCFAITAHRD